MKKYAFMGKFNHKVDCSRRITIPSDFFKQLDDKVLFLTKLSVHETPMIAVFPTSELLFKKLVEVYGFDFDNKADRQAILEDSYRREIDSAKRINLGCFDFSDGDEVIVVGNLDSFEIWDIASYEEHSQKVRKHNI